MPDLKKYRRKEGSTITAVRLDLETKGFAYEKWDGTQICKPGDWLVCNDGDTYTINADTFAETYKPVSPGVYRKDVPVWAERAEVAGVTATKEGSTAYEAGDMLVYNKEGRVDGYAMSADRFDSLYKAD